MGRENSSGSLYVPSKRLHLKGKKKNKKQGHFKQSNIVSHELNE